MGAGSLWPDCYSHGQVQLVTIQPHTSLTGGVMGQVHSGLFGWFCTFMKKTFASKNTNLNGSRFSFLKETSVLVFKLRPSSGTILGSVFFLDEILANFDLKKNYFDTMDFPLKNYPNSPVFNFFFSRWPDFYDQFH